MQKGKVNIKRTAGYSSNQRIFVNPAKFRVPAGLAAAM
jgi:hypothetical protein